jgi:hypothetical protein
MDLKGEEFTVDLSGHPPEPVITDDQIERAAEILRRTLRSHRNELPYDSVEYLLGGMLKGSGFGEVLLRAVHKCVDELVILRRVKVDRSRTPQAALAATGQRLMAAPQDVETIPRGKGDTVVIGLFRVLDRYTIQRGDLDMHFKFHGLIPDPIALAALAEADPAFVDVYTPATQWRGSNGSYYGMSFNKNRGERSILINEMKDHPAAAWSCRFWFGGRMK